MRYGIILLTLLLAACGDDSMTRDFSLSRDAAPDTVGATQMPLSMPPNMAERPRPRGAMALSASNPGSDANPPAVGNGQGALLDAAGASANPDIRNRIDETSGLVFPPGDFVDRVMTWAPPPGYVSLLSSPHKGWFGWF
jgi:hypothetical protein